MEFPDSRSATTGPPVDLTCLVPYFLQAAQSRWAAGAADSASHLFRIVLSLAPDHAEAWHGLALAVTPSGDIDRAIRKLSRADRLRPDDHAIMLNLANLWMLIERPQPAISLLRAVAPRAHDRPEFWNSLGLALRSMMEAAESERAFRIAQLLAPNHAEAYLNHGTLAIGLGRTDIGLRRLDRALYLQPGSADILFSRAQAKSVTPTDPDWQTLRAVEAGVASVPLPQQVTVHFALAKAYDDVGDADAAMEHWQQANAIEAARHPYDEPAVLGLFPRLTQLFDADFLAARRGLGDPDRRPLFIVGMPRSGSTLLAQILATHPDIVEIGETPSLGVALQSVLRGSQGGMPEALPDALQGAAIRAAASVYRQEIEGLRPGAAKRIVDKSLVNFMMVGVIHVLFPQARILHTRRDPVDCCLSIFGHHFNVGMRFRHDLGRLGRYYRHYQRLMEHWRRLLPATAMRDVVYEDVVGDLEGQARGILDFCGVSWNSRCLSFYRSNRLVRTASAAQVRLPIYRSALRRSQRYGEALAPLRAALAIDPEF